MAFSEYLNFSFSSKVVVYIVEMRSHHDLGLLTCALKQKKDLPSLWPFRCYNSAPPQQTPHFYPETQNTHAHMATITHTDEARYLLKRSCRRRSFTTIVFQLTMDAKTFQTLGLVSNYKCISIIHYRCQLSYEYSPMIFDHQKYSFFKSSILLL